MGPLVIAGGKRDDGKRSKAVGSLAMMHSKYGMREEEPPTMGVLTENEIAYLCSQRLACLATVRLDGAPQIAPVGVRYAAEQDVISIGGRCVTIALL
jgi:hypothetical protein